MARYYLSHHCKATDKYLVFVGNHFKSIYVDKCFLSVRNASQEEYHTQNSIISSKVYCNNDNYMVQAAYDQQVLPTKVITKL